VPPWLALAAAILALIWSLVSGWLAIGAVVQRRRFEARERGFSPPKVAHRVLLIRPCAGEEASLEHCMLSVAEALHDFPLDVAFGVSEASDPAVATLERVIESLRTHDIRASLHVVSPAGPNRKACTLAGIVEEIGHDYPIIINADSNVDLGGYDLDQLVGRLAADENLGAAWSPFIEVGEDAALGTRSCVALLGASLAAFPLLAGLSPRNLSGKFWAARVEAVMDAGGFARLRDYLGEDFEMERALHAAGRPVVAVPLTARAVAPRLSFGEAIRRVARWMTVVRAQRPILLPAYPLLFASTPLNVALAGLGLAHQPILSSAALSIAVAARLLVAWAGEVYSGRGWGPVKMLVDAFLSDALILSAWVRALSTRQVEWRGNTLRTDASGKLRAVPRAGL
jgi:ceramide glucosyltransferase